MERHQILEQLHDIFREVLDHDNVSLNDSTTANDVDDWDSLNHIQLIVGIEKHFKIRFTSREIQSWNNVGEMITCIEEKLR
jgi:acyl carrier protein